MNIQDDGYVSFLKRRMDLSYNSEMKDFFLIKIPKIEKKYKTKTIIIEHLKNELSIFLENKTIFPKMNFNTTSDCKFKIYKPNYVNCLLELYLYLTDRGTPKLIIFETMYFISISQFSFLEE